MSEREANIRRDWADCVGADDPDQLDQWAVDQICDLQATIDRILHFATGKCRLSDVDRILCIAKECEDAEVNDEH